MCSGWNNLQIDMPCLKVAVESDPRDEWKRSIKEELQSLDMNDTWDVIAMPKFKDIVWRN